MIELSSPDELFNDPEMLAMAKGQVELPSTKSVRELREKLHRKVEAHEQLSIDELKQVNTFSRLDLIKDKMREVTEKCRDNEAIDVFDLLAMDWVYSDRAEWEGSLADIQMKKMLTEMPNV